MQVMTSQSVADDFSRAATIQMPRFVAQNLINDNTLLNDYFNVAKAHGWTKAESLDEYLRQDHGAVYTAAFLTAYNIQ